MKSIIHRLIAFMLLISCSFSFGQTILDCRTEDSASAQREPYLAKNSSTPASYYCIKIYVHVIRPTNGIGGQSAANVQQAINILQDDFNPYQIYFNWDGIIHDINDSSVYDEPAGSNIFGWYNHTDGVDIYLFSDDNEFKGGIADPSTTAFFLSGIEDVSQQPFVTSHYISHEMGHIFNLLHTHNGCDELPNGENSGLDVGDKVGDTPPDPNMKFRVDSNCDWLGPGYAQTYCHQDLAQVYQTYYNESIDPLILAASYNPDPTNFMAYSRPSCMSQFSQGQVDRMFDAIASMDIASDCPIGVCPENIVITQSVTDTNVTDIKEAEISVLAKNVIEVDASALYDAGESVTLGTRFHAKYGSTFRAFIDGCSGLTAPRNAVINEKEEVLNDIKVYPNPAENVVNLSHNYLNIQSFTLYDIHGRKVKYQNVINNTKHTIDVSNFDNGIYILSITLEDNSVITKQLIIE